ncbi:EaA protein [Klebsiella phage vB_KpnS-VAC113]|uniref:EaA protein n=1 Tax=Klebsiella phage vB_KpnS-VAC113 TaxID=2866702 RepID=A0AAE9C6U9_9CAUD|nr:EaA protein [Klebsiella phage vB_KpnS-VAC113]
MSDEIETIDKNPKSWAAWKREAERLQAIIDDVALAATQEPAPERDNVRSEHAESVRDPFRLVRQAHAEWSDRQFGNVGPVGPLKHLAKEAIEAAEAPDDISEFADIIMLVWDATRRAGFSDEQLAEAVAEKLERNKRRQWGAVKDGEPCHHLKN